MVEREVMIEREGIIVRERREKEKLLASIILKLKLYKFVLYSSLSSLVVTSTFLEEMGISAATLASKTWY